MAEPVIDVSSVTISPAYLPCAVYGDISACDQLDSTLPTYELYRRDAEHAELISETEQTLSVIDLDKILFMQQPVISFNLKVKDSMAEADAFIARGTVDLDITTNNDYEEVKQSDVKGDCGHAMVNYVALSCALVANIKAFLSDNLHVVPDVQGQVVSQQVSDLKCSLYGSIIAHYGMTFGHVNHFRIPLLNASSDRSIPIFFDGRRPMPTVKLTRNYVAVPAYSSLNIKANLRSTLSSMPVVNEEDSIILWPVNWRATPRLEKNEIPPQYKNVFRTSTNWGELFDLQPSSRRTKRKSVDCGGEILFEVFSVFIGRENDHDVKVTGKITLHHYNSDIVIFNRDNSNPDQLLGGRKLLNITCPSIPEFFSPLIHFILRVDLNADDRVFIEDGIVNFRTTFIEDWESQFDRPLCAVLNGDNGYCAVHYSMFMSAARVGLKIVLLCKGVDVAKVHGKIVAWSDIFDYTRGYNRKYYRRVLYNELDDQEHYPRKVASKKAIQGSDGRNLGQVDLLESCVAVPLAFNFNISVDLSASSRTSSSPAEHLHKTFLFRYSDDKPMMEILGEDFDLHIQKI